MNRVDDTGGGGGFVRNFNCCATTDRLRIFDMEYLMNRKTVSFVSVLTTA